jgi:uncharacterized protein with NAD-binding domain and iron-sulfur cluster
MLTEEQVTNIVRRTTKEEFAEFARTLPRMEKAEMESIASRAALSVLDQYVMANNGNYDLLVKQLNEEPSWFSKWQREYFTPTHDSVVTLVAQHQVEDKIEDRKIATAQAIHTKRAYQVAGIGVLASLAIVLWSKVIGLLIKLIEGVK